GIIKLESMKSGNTRTDSLPMLLTIEALNDTVFSWKSSFIRASDTLVKDYLIRVETNRMVLDEQNGLLFEHSGTSEILVFVYEVNGTLYHVRYDLRIKDQIDFELSYFKSGDSTELENNTITPFQLAGKQYALLKLR
ncbi:MAG: hypothetical protein LPK49_10180, partial [Bacteroidota bacterium]|nr:hypothetical protein [Bacteroidota bacterium]